MGILYNRFTPEPPPFLIPYSNRSDIVTYLTPDNFKGSNSTTWGAEYPKPMERDTFQLTAGTWEYNSDDSINLRANTATGANFSIPMLTDRISTYTVYMAVRYNLIEEITSDYPPLFRLINDEEYNIQIYRTYDGVTVSARIPSVTGEDFYISNLTPVGSAFGNYHVYAFRRQNNNFCHVVDDGNLVAITTRNVSTLASYNFDFIPDARFTVDVKFLSIVKGAESDSTILNNVNNIMTELNIP